MRGGTRIHFAHSALILGLFVARAPAQNLVVNSDFSQGNTGFGTDYTYRPSSNNDEGQYTVRANGGCGWNASFVCIADHSPSADQFMFVGNGDLAVAQRVWFQTVTVTPGTTYLFEMWGATAVTGGPAQLEASINGVVLGTLTCPATPQMGWIALSTPWTAGPGETSATITIINRNTAEFPNDFYMDDISLTPPAEVCEGDADGNGVVNFADITSVLTNFGMDYLPPPPPNTGPGDANGNGMVNFADVTSVLTHFGEMCS